MRKDLTMPHAQALEARTPTSLARFGRRLRSRLAPGQGERPGRPSDPTWIIQRKLSMSAETLANLERIASSLSNDSRQVSPMQVAALIVEEAAERLVNLTEH
jgi:hypothetical protein